MYISKLLFSINYSKNPHNRTSGLRTRRLKFGQKNSHIHRNTFSLKDENCSYIYIYINLAASYIRITYYGTVI